MKRRYINLLAGMLFLISGGLAFAQAPLSLSMNFSNPMLSYNFAEPVGINVTLQNTASKPLYVTKGLCSRSLYFDMKVIDPAGRLLLPDRGIENTEYPDAPPLPFCYRNDNVTPVQISPYDILQPGESCTKQVADIRPFYQLKLPGIYSFQAQLSVMAFQADPGDPCVGDIAKYEFLGLVKSETLYVNLAGGTDVDISPKQWSPTGTGDITAIIWPEPGLTVDDYKTEFIQLNNVPAKRVLKMYSSVKGQYYLLAFFDRQQSINSLGTSVPGSEYNIVVSGMKRNNHFFGGGEKITIIN